MYGDIAFKRYENIVTNPKKFDPKALREKYSDSGSVSCKSMNASYMSQYPTFSAMETEKEQIRQPPPLLKTLTFKEKA